MKTLLFVLISTFIIGFSGSVNARPETKPSLVIQEPADDDGGFTYEYVNIDGKVYVYVYLDGVLVEIFEEEE